LGLKSAIANLRTDARHGRLNLPKGRKLHLSFEEAATPDQIWLFPSMLSTTGHIINVDKPFKRVVESAKFDPKQDVRHTLRHTAITHLVQAGVDLPTVQRISGHKTLQMVVRYSHQNGEHIQVAMDALERGYDLIKEVSK
jgi:site-specific recombinase XerD